jgi:hypothetical protein
MNPTFKVYATDAMLLKHPRSSECDATGRGFRFQTAMGLDTSAGGTHGIFPLYEFH